MAGGSLLHTLTAKVGLMKHQIAARLIFTQVWAFDHLESHDMASAPCVRMRRAMRALYDTAL